MERELLSRLACAHWQWLLPPRRIIDPTRSHQTIGAPALRGGTLISRHRHQQLCANSFGGNAHHIGLEHPLVLPFLSLFYIFPTTLFLLSHKMLWGGIFERRGRRFNYFCREEGRFEREWFLFSSHPIFLYALNYSPLSSRSFSSLFETFLRFLHSPHLGFYIF